MEKNKNELINKYPTLKNAPIIEALLDIRVKLPKDVKLKDLEIFQKYIKEQFKEKKKKMSYKRSIKLTPKGTPELFSTSVKHLGYLFRSPGENKIVQVRLDGFTFNKLKPYENWKKFFNEAKNLWLYYIKTAKPLRVNRIALRYINHIEIPLPIKDFKEYVKTIPEIAPGLPQSLSDFFMRITIPCPEIDSTAIITQTVKKVTKDIKLPFIFDIDVFQQKVYNPDDNNIWKKFEKLRNFKNTIFFESLTKKAKDLFK